MKVIKKSVTELEPAIFNKLKNLNMRDRGAMQGDFIACRNDPRSKVYYILENDIVLSWCLVDASTQYGDYPFDAQFYTRKTERKKGLSTLIIEEVLKDFKIRVFPWSEPSKNFFRKFGSKYPNLITVDKFD